MWKMLLAGGLLGALLLSAGISRSDGTSTTPDPAATSVRPTIVPNPGNESPPRDPFTPYDTGGPQAEWSYDKLTPEEKAVADRGLDTEAQDATHAVWERANEESRRASRAAVAAHGLGVSGIADIGVIP